MDQSLLPWQVLKEEDEWKRNMTRRGEGSFKEAAYAAPAILTLQATSALAKSGSEKQPKEPRELRKPKKPQKPEKATKAMDVKKLR